MKRGMALTVLAVLSGAVVLAAEQVGVRGSDRTFPAVITAAVGDQQVRMTLTGTALRKKLFFNVYAIGSYLQEGVTARDAQDLASKDTAKQLHLVMERDVDGPDMAEAFVAGIRRNYAAPAFAEELQLLAELIRANPVKKGDVVLLTHIPQVGLHCQLVGKTEQLIKNVAFAQAVWEIYLGRNNIDDAIRKSLTSRL